MALGSRTIQTGHQYVQAGSHLTQAPAYSLVETPASNQVVTNALPVPAVPVPSPAAAIPKVPSFIAFLAEGEINIQAKASDASGRLLGCVELTVNAHFEL